MKKTLAFLLAAMMTVGMLAGCGGDEPEQPSDVPAETPFELSVNFASEPQTIDPALNSAVDGAIMINHMFEGLMKWEDSGNEANGADGTATLARITYGQAESYDKAVNEDGTVTYTFKLRDDAKWSDGQAVTAQDFVYSWQRLVTPETAADYNYMIDCVVGANEIMAGEADPSTLAVSAADEKTFVVTITTDLPYFTEICAFPATFPVRQDIIEAAGDQWTFDTDTYIGNGAYKMTSWEHNAAIVMEPNEQYYDYANLGPDKITFKLMDDQNAMLTGFNSGELDFIQQVPQAELAGKIASGDMKIVDYIGTYYVCFQTQKAPFDDPRVRQAFALAIDRTYIVENVSQAGEVEAGGFVPAGIYDAAGANGDDFRTTGGNYYEPTEAEYEANCEKARALLAEAGYPNGEGFPVVEYLYNTADNHKAIGEALQYMWEKELGVTVTLNNQEWGTFLETRKNGDYSIARNGWIADYNDPMSFIDMWMTDGGNNDAQYANPEYDALVAAAKVETDPAVRMDLLHQAEDILMGEDWVLAPIYFYTQMHMMRDGVDGVFYTPLGYYFFMYATEA